MGTPGPEAGGFAPGHGVWQPVPHGEYDSDQTMHVSFAAQLSMTEPGADPLAAPGHGYAPQPPQGPPDIPLTVGTAAPAGPARGEDPATTWAIPVVRDERPEHPGDPGDSGEYSVGAFASAPDPAPWAAGAGRQAPPPAPPPAPPSEGWSLPPDATGQWKLPITPDGTAEESGEYRLPDSAPLPPEVAEPVPAPHDGPADPGADAGAAGDEDASAEQAGADEPEDPHSEHPLASYVLNVNGTDRPVTDAWLGESLLYVLRERLGLAGAKDGCEQGECGACSVKVDGRLVASCLVPAATAAGSDVRTVEGLSTDGRPSDVQRALAECGAVQCGFCIPGLAMTVHDLLEGNHHPSELETRQAISGNLCRCSGYHGVLEAVRTVVAEREEAAEAADGADGEPAAEAARVPHPRPSTGGPA
ncbi:2Fe-2S iron-sulfur cluster-binding protein [Streptomyces sp. NPDC046977]|uniref:2Fe-2S iron-sulfur cluster-binding protein n=1 Tax=Streptomyces sp. NPDC046977 TaxID=3154703 RepID=UPI0033D94C74